MNETLDSSLPPSIKDFKTWKYLIKGWQIFKTRFFWLFILSFSIAGFNILCQGVLSWYFMIVIPVFLYPLLYASIYGLANGARLREHLESDDFFVGIEYFASLGYARFIQTALQFLLLIPCLLLYSPLKYVLAMYFGADLPESVMLIPAIIFILILLYVVIAYIFTDQYIIFKGQNYWQAMTSSRKLVNSKFGSVLLMIVIINFIALVLTIKIFFIYLYIQFRSNFIEGSFLDFFKNFGLYSFNSESFIAALSGIICLNYPFIYSVLHAAFADIEDLPTEEYFEIEPT